MNELPVRTAMSLQSAVVFEGQGKSHDMPILSGHFWTFSSKSLGVQKPDVTRIVAVQLRLKHNLLTFSYINSCRLAGLQVDREYLDWDLNRFD